MTGSVQALFDRETAAERAIEKAIAERDAVRRVFGKAVRREREARGISMRAMATRCEVSPAFLGDLELGRRWSIAVAWQLRQALK